MTYSSEYFLVSFADCKVYLGIDDSEDNSIVGYLMNAVSEMFNTTTKRTLVAADLTEYHEGDGTNTLYLRSAPVNSTTDTIAVYIDADRTYGSDTQVASENLWINSEVGSVVYVGGAFHRGYPIKVVYNGGYAQSEVPHDLRLAALEALGVLYKRHQEGRFDTSTLSRGDVSYTYFNEFPYMVTDTIRRYRNW